MLISAAKSKRPETRSPDLPVWILRDAGEIVSIHATEQQAQDAREEHILRIYAWSAERDVGEYATEVIPMRLQSLWGLTGSIESVPAAGKRVHGELTASEARRFDERELVSCMEDLLGTKLVAYISSASGTRSVRHWANGESTPTATMVRLRVAYAVASLLRQTNSAEVVQAWLQGANPLLDDVSPARLLREGDLDDINPKILAAALAFST